MAGLRDYDGKIVIDESEANKDINYINDARAKLEAAVRLLDPAKLDRTRMEGETRVALESQLTAAIKKIRAQMDNCASMSRYIKDVVAKYRQIDREMAERMRG
ncbi:hypothetical protein AGMMS50276_09290 [Synergistales bacterium]|nr:hypothetical protein AGMMS50276_09290 [Synergistales bacterium]